jgi:predicted MFS family arabinose efflux permease
LKLIFACFAFAYFLSYALRSVNAAIAPSLVSDLSLNAEQLGKLTSAYLLAFALLQVPLGVWLDRFGARRTESALLIVAAVGCVVFATAQSYVWLWVGRALIGAGVCGCLMAAFKGFRDWFDPALQSRLAAYMLVAGTCGVLTTTVPVQWLVEKAGWRPVFFLAAGLLLISSAALFFCLPKAHNTHDVTTTQLAANDRQLSSKDILREPYFWRMGILCMVFVGGFVAMQSLWVGPWMTTVLGFDSKTTANHLFVFNFALMLSYLFLGTLAPRIEAKGFELSQLSVGFNSVGLIVLMLIASYAEPAAWWLWLALAASTSINTILQPRVAMFYPAALGGRANAWFNLLIFIGAFALQWGFGFAVEMFKRAGKTTTASYQASLWCYIGLAAVTLAIFVVWRPAPPKFASELTKSANPKNNAQNQQTNA